MGSTTAPSSSPDAPLPRGLVFFRPGVDPAFKRRRLIGVFLLLLVGASAIWPIYPLFAGVSPRFWGLPLSLAWLVLGLVAVFAIVLWLFLKDEH